MTVTLRVNHTLTYRAVIPDEVLKYYLVDRYNTFDVTDEVFREMQIGRNVSLQLVETQDLRKLIVIIIFP